MSLHFYGLTFECDASIPLLGLVVLGLTGALVTFAVMAYLTDPSVRR